VRQLTTDAYERRALDSIHVDRENRQRKKLDTTSLEKSIARIGVLNPIIIDRNGVLIAGECRYVASQNLGLTDIPVRYADTLSPVESKIIELEENLKRTELAWNDSALATAQIHDLYCKTYPEWRQQDTAEQLSLTQGTVSMVLRVSDALRHGIDLSACTSMRNAFNLIDRREQRAGAIALEEIITGVSAVLPAPELEVDAPLGGAAEAPAGNAELIGGLPHAAPKGAAGAKPKPKYKSEEQCILHQSFLEWAPKYRGPKFNFIHCDFPYGNDEFGASRDNPAWGSQMSSKLFQQAKYESSSDTFVKLLECLLENLDRLMSHSAHFMFWFTAEPVRLTQVMRQFNERVPWLQFAKFPIIWHKTDNAGIIPDAKRQLRHVYETALIASRSDLPLVRAVSDAYGAPTQRSTREHPSMKPEPVLRHFFRAFVDTNTRILDPTCGSASALRVGEEMGAQILGLEVNENIVADAREDLRRARLLRTTS
jgi:DNA modification methylase